MNFYNIFADKMSGISFTENNIVSALERAETNSCEVIQFQLDGREINLVKTKKGNWKFYIVD